MDTLPTEITDTIINYIDPDVTLIASMVCVHWHRFIHNKCAKLTNNFTNILETNSYALYAYYTKNGIHHTIMTINLSHISGHNCLKIITYLMSCHTRSIDITKFAIISRKLCETNNTAIKKFLNKPSLKSRLFVPGVLDSLLFRCLNYGSYDVADYFIMAGASPNEWVSYITKCNIYTPHCREFIKPLQYLIDSHAINLPIFYKQMTAHSDKYLCLTLASYARKYFNPHMKLIINK